jgi:AcrR family transcriptional regulator
LRFGWYGFGKNTMAEIAKDCEVSSGNLYCYFKIKKVSALITAVEFCSRDWN